MESRGQVSWRIGIRRWEALVDHALWIRAAERIEVPGHRLVPGPLDIDDLPPPSEVPGSVPGIEWLDWWLSLVGAVRRRRTVAPPDVPLEPADETPDPLGLAPLPALRRVVARRWPEAQDFHLARQREGIARYGPGSSSVTGDVVRQAEQSLGRSVRPFSVEFILLPVRDDVIRRVDQERYLVPERVFDSPRWRIWLRDLVLRIG